MKILLILTLVLMSGTALVADEGDDAVAAPSRVALETSKGQIVIELDSDRAPISSASFLDNVDSGFYDGTIFHRVIPNFMIQGGGFTPDVNPKSTDKLLKNEADNGLKNLRGTLAMARRGEPDSASVQFFINLIDNVPLDHRDKGAGWGYAVFGKVVEGMEVVDAIAAVETGRRGPMKDVPVEAVVIKSAKRVGE